MKNKTNPKKVTTRRKNNLPDLKLRLDIINIILSIVHTFILIIFSLIKD